MITRLAATLAILVIFVTGIAIPCSHCGKTAEVFPLPFAVPRAYTTTIVCHDCFSEWCENEQTINYYPRITFVEEWSRVDTDLNGVNDHWRTDQI